MEMIVLGFYGHSNSGKTTIIDGLVSRYRKRCLSVAVIKHTAHRGFELDVEGSDSWRHAKAGADAVGLLSNDRAAVLVHRLPKEEGTRAGKDVGDVAKGGGAGLLFGLVSDAVRPDLLFLEGFKHSGVEKVAVGDIALLPGTVHRLAGPDDAAGLRGLVELIDKKLKKDRARSRLPGADCGRCGLDCDRFAEKVASGERKLSECTGHSEVGLKLVVDGTIVPLSRFPGQMVAGALVGILSSLKMPSGETIGERKRRSIVVRLER